ncbi:MAG: tRNA threonylcarbamoyladenosine biosynthesis protein TsaE [Chlamydiia bacterium]|nr:tRNA threonylcarbamoyladenosine biosynthesis protein TsaE [Chlamydiia bacterium]
MHIQNLESMTYDLNEMDLVASKIAQTLRPGDIITLKGDLGAGKTTFARFLCKHLGIKSIISSPTFTYLNIYEDKVAHFDLYRLKNKDQFFALGFEEYIESEFITLIEWPEIIEAHLPQDTIRVSFSHVNSKRRIEIL